MTSSVNREAAENKIILLYTVEKANMPISNLQITKILMENRMMNYFVLQHFLTDLCENGHLQTEKKDNQTFYSITDSGKKLLSYFLNIVPAGFKKTIDEAIYSFRRSKKYETAIKAEYTAKSENDFIVKLSICEGDFSLIELNIAVGSRDNAREICSRWKSNPQEIYSEIIETLTKER
ncbi:MAG TPA: DUF4364 family protein [Clostridiaceae bacterium]|nr:DUF4364 family protein [Clostridiaceae bacterium]